MSKNEDTEGSPTTIQISQKTHNQLAAIKFRHVVSFDKVIQMLLASQTDVYFKMIVVDNELPQTHTAVFQLGDKPDSLYYFDGDSPKPIRIEEVQAMIKQPMESKLAFTRKEVEELECQLERGTELQKRMLKWLKEEETGETSKKDNPT